MKRFFYWLNYFILFLIGFSLLKYSYVLDINAQCRSEAIAKFFVMLIVLIAVTRWGCKLYTLITGYKP